MVPVLPALVSVMVTLPLFRMVAFALPVPPLMVWPFRSSVICLFAAMVMFSVASVSSWIVLGFLLTALTAACRLVYRSLPIWAIAVATPYVPSGFLAQFAHRRRSRRKPTC